MSYTNPRVFPALSVMIVSLAAGPAYASADLAKAKGCLACHQEQANHLGPSYKNVAAKYKGRKDAVDYLAGAIKKGNLGQASVWNMPALKQMPPNNVTEAEAKTLAAWIMTIK
jgi:cytochrome c